MGFLRRLWGYIKALFTGTAERMMDPAVEIEQAIQQAERRSQQLRNQAAKVVAHRTMLENKIESAADEVGEAREMAKQALLRAEEAKAAGDAAGVEKWTGTAQSLAMKLQAAENNLNSLKEQYQAAITQSESAKQAVQQNAMRLQELAAKRMELLGTLEQAKMQETVNQAVQAMSSGLDLEAPSLDKVEEKIDRRLAEAQAKAELREATPQGAEDELRQAVSLAKADEKLAELKQELGLTE